MELTCIVCGKKFEAKKSTKKYCSLDCVNAKRRADRITKGRGTKDYNGMPEKQCLICQKSFKPKTAASNQRTCCYTCMPEGVQLKRGDFLALLKKAWGGRCIKCGYDKCIKALEFHHLDPTKKDFTISNRSFKLKEALEESKKCILICSNCHKELHAGLWTLEDLERKEE